jgi:hypothetical protein
MTMWIKVNKNHDHWAAPRRMISFKAGDEPRIVKREIGDALIAAGVAEEVEAPARSESETDTPASTSGRAKK